MDYNKLFGWLRYLLSGTRTEKVKSEPKAPSQGMLKFVSRFLSQKVLGTESETLSQLRNDHIGKLEKTAEDEEAQNRELEERLEFKRREDEVLGRIRGARSHRAKLWELLGEYGTRRPRLLRWVIIGVGLFVLLSLLIMC